ncbi:MAG: glycosyl hydrolase family 18 protein, partial [Chloroflexota bacterium]
PSASPDAPLDAPVVDPSDVGEGDGASVLRTAESPDGDLAAAVSPDGLRKEIFGFLPYWELDSSLVLDYSRLSTIAFFGVGASAAGNLEKTKDGKATVGWSGWTSSRMTSVINEAHRNNTRVVLTVQSFGWSDAGLTKQKSLLGSATARANLAKQVATAIRDRGADGVNLDFEPLASGYGDQFVDLVKRIRKELDAVQKGYQLTFDTLGYIGNYPIEAATAAGAADAIFIMGYDYRNGSTSKVGSIAPLGGPTYDIADTIRAYTARVSASKLILGVPYYGRAWSTDSDKLNATNISGTKNGASSTVIYNTAVGVLADHGRRYDATEGVAWTAYKRENCTATYGCVTPWRQLYVDDAQALKAKYDLVNAYGLRGAGIWALGYDAARPELWNAIRDKFITDTTPPRAGIKVLAPSQSSESFTVTWASADDFAVASHDVDVAIDGGSWARWLSASAQTSAAYVGARGHTFAFRVRARDHKGNVSSWTGVPASGAATIGVGGFGRVQTDELNARSGAGTDKSIVTKLDTGDVVAFLEGPVSASGYQWFRVAAPLREWSIVGATRTDLWVAIGSGSDAFVAAAAPPNTTKVTSGATLAASTPGAEWTAVTPVRLLDTRVDNGLSGTFADGSVRSFQLAGRGGIPSDAVAITGNLTVTGATSAGYVSIGASMVAKPSTSTINFAKGQTVANGLTLRIGSGGKVSAVFDGAAGSRTHLVLDVTGFYRDDSAAATWYPMAPARLMDSRTGNGLSGAFKSRTVRTLTIAGRGGIPSDAIAVTGNLTATGATGSGYVAAGPTMTSSPTTSTLNLARGRTQANNLTLRLGAGGKVGMVFVGASGTSVHLVLDVTGYYRAGNGGAEWFAVTPTRLLDTRTGNGLAGAFVDQTVRTYQLTGRGTVPVDAVAVTGNLTVTGSTSAGYASTGPTMTAKPSTSTINFVKGQTLANGLTLRIGSVGKVAAVFDGATGAKVHQIVDLTGYFR